MLNTITLWGLLFAIFPISAAAIEQFKSEQEAQQHCPDDTVVWLNLKSKSIHAKGQPWYGRTHLGAYICKAELAKKGSKPVAKKALVDASAWVKIIEDQTKTVYASAAPVEKVADRVTVLSMVDLKKTSKLSDGKEFLSWQTQYEFDCNTMQSKMIAAAMYAGNMGSGEVVGSVVYESPSWQIISAESNGVVLWKRACGKK